MSSQLLGNIAHGKNDPSLVNGIGSERTISPWQEVTSLDCLSAVTLVIAVSLTETLEAYLWLQEISAPVGSEACKPRQLLCLPDEHLASLDLSCMLSRLLQGLLGVLVAICGARASPLECPSVGYISIVSQGVIEPNKIFPVRQSQKGFRGKLKINL